MWTRTWTGHRLNLIRIATMATNKLTHLAAINLVKAGKKGRTGDGGGLWLDVRAPDRAAWVFRYTLHGFSREVGLGAFRDVKLADVRDRAASCREQVSKGVHPCDQRVADEEAAVDATRAAAAAADAEKITFRFAAEARIEAKGAEYRNPKHRQQWGSTLAAYVYPVFGDRPVSSVTREDVLRALQPIWSTKPETATRVRQRIEVVLDYAASRDWRSGANPATWRGNLSHLLPSTKKTVRVQHHPALPWNRMPAMMEALKMSEGMGALALRFAILTAARSGEVRGATWGEVNGTTWTVPGSRMKAGRTHRVPLSAAALDILAQARPFWRSNDPSALIFPGEKVGRSLSDMTLAAVIKRLNKGDSAAWVDHAGQPVVPHGFRSTFRDWCADNRQEPSDVVEKALAHAISNQTEAAYRRGDLYDRRAPLMEAWSSFCVGAGAGNVVSIRQARS